MSKTEKLNQVIEELSQSIDPREQKKAQEFREKQKEIKFDPDEIEQRLGVPLRLWWAGGVKDFKAFQMQFEAAVISFIPPSFQTSYNNLLLEINTKGIRICRVVEKIEKVSGGFKITLRDVSIMNISVGGTIAGESSEIKVEMKRNAYYESGDTIELHLRLKPLGCPTEGVRTTIINTQ